MRRRYLDATWHIGPLYLDLSGGLEEFVLGAVLQLSRDGGAAWGNRLSVHLGLVCISVGYERE